MLNLSEAILIENGTYIFRCSGCPKLIKTKPYYASKHSGKCRSCCMRKPAFHHVFRRFVNTSKYEGHAISITYDGFLKFTNIKNCHYCERPIPWAEFCYHKGSYLSGGYFLDRKDNTVGYHDSNCVVCCTRCNRAKSDKYTYKEWFEMNQIFRNKHEKAKVG